MAITTDDAVDAAARQFDSVMAASREMKNIVDGLTDSLFKSVNRSIRDQPITTLAVAAAVGLALGVLRKR